MSYILEALKKSDQQRQRGVTPTLPAAPITVAAPKRLLLMYYGALTVVLLGIGITIGWLRPWQAEHPAPAAVPIAAKPPVPAPQQTAPVPLAAPPEMVKKAAQELPAPVPLPSAQAAFVVEAIKPDIPASAATPVVAAAPAPQVAPESTAIPVGVAQEQEAIAKTELPPAIQQEIPPLTIQLHAYANHPGERLVSINFKMLREGESLMPGLRLEQITPDGVIFGYKGYRFRQGAR